MSLPSPPISSFTFVIRHTSPWRFVTVLGPYSVATHALPPPSATPLTTLGVVRAAVCSFEANTPPHSHCLISSDSVPIPDLSPNCPSPHFLPALNVALVAWQPLALIVVVIVHTEQLLAERAAVSLHARERWCPPPLASISACVDRFHSAFLSTPSLALWNSACCLWDLHNFTPITIDNRTDIANVEKALHNNRVEDIQGNLGWDEQVDDEDKSGRMEWLKDADVDGLTRFLSEQPTLQKMSPFSSLSLDSLPGAFFSLWNKSPITGSSFRSRSLALLQGRMVKRASPGFTCHFASLSHSK
ncbi:hypothetical protein BLNAU_12371 [Blattamonas nauphoetae]|uniref:Uncharacterized protein n=1 Tax=Blattamonas nauphoetae TaxID=2049346 RepID=A0ABQ9XQ19_9EUKA|nr:hypothetical protein BLNAU_12371 [Blattamonas nauphoetae]